MQKLLSLGISDSQYQDFKCVLFIVLVLVLVFHSAQIFCFVREHFHIIIFFLSLETECISSKRFVNY